VKTASPAYAERDALGGAAAAVSAGLADRLPTILQQFRPRIRIRLENNRFIAKTADDGRELALCLRLRHAVFYEECLGRRHPSGVDLDQFDPQCDHLLVLERPEGRCVGTYRILCSSWSDRFYSATEFHLANIVGLPGTKLELGRACVAPEYRDHRVLGWLWRGIGEYVKRCNASYLFGCSSVKTTRPSELAALYAYFRQRHLAAPDAQVRPKRRLALKGLCELLPGAVREFSSAWLEGLIPPLLRLYLRMGAVICGEPAIDRAFCCADFFTLLATSAVSVRTDQKYRQA
jgi:putative hemolysin